MNTTLDPKLSFTAHNVRLDDGGMTYAGAGRTIDETGNYRAVKGLLQLLFPEGWQGRSLVDLGCLEGGFATEFARLGLVATGIDVRESNITNAEYIRSRVDLPNLRFVRDDAWNVGRYGPFDIVFCVGLHYHIEDQRRFLGEMAQACGRAIVIDTHFAPEADEHPAVAFYHLSELTEHEGLPGRWYPEHELDHKAEKAALEQLKWASWENQRSFWPTKGALVEAMRGAGFGVVLEDFASPADQHGMPFAPGAWRSDRARSRFVGIKTQPVAPPERPKVPDPSARRLGLLLGRSALRGRTLLVGEGMPQPPGEGHAVVRATSLERSDGVFADILARGLFLGGGDPAAVFEALARRLGPGGIAGLEIADARAGGGALTPEGFLDLAEGLARAGRFPFRIEGFQATEDGGQDFVVRLGRTDPAATADILGTVAAARPLLDAAGSWRPAPAPPPAPDLAHFRAEVEAARAEPLPAPGPWQALKSLFARFAGRSL
jgi:SAM-dependent methyltransferase